MPLDTYANLKTTLVKWTRRNDLPDVIDDVIDICEAEIYANQMETLKVRELETRATASTTEGSRFLALPTGYLEMRRLNITANGQQKDILYRTPESLNIYPTSGVPKFYSVRSELEFDRAADSTYTVEMLYYAKPTALSSANTANTVLTNYPNIYLFGCRWAAYDFAGEDTKADREYAKFISAIRGANRKDRGGRHPSGAAARVETSTP